MVLLGLFGIVLIGGFVLWSRVQSQVGSITEQTDDQIRKTYQQLYDSAESGDIDVFRTIISARDENWARAQQRLVIDKGLLNREVLGLLPLSTQPRIKQILIAPELRSAEMLVEVDYAVNIGNGLTQTVTLERHEFFGRGGNNQWLLTAPEASYWGTVFEQEGRTFNVIGNERDAALIRRIQSDLDDFFSQQCQQYAELPCVDGFKRPVVFTTNPESLVQLSTQTLLQAPERTITVPTPSLLGRNTNAASYDALLAGYTKLIFTPTIAELTGYPCCNQLALFDALINYQLAELGIWVSDISAENATTLLATDAPLTISDWSITPLQAQALTEFILHEAPDLSPAFLQQTLGNAGQSPQLWLRDIVAMQPPANGLNEEWTMDPITGMLSILTIEEMADIRFHNFLQTQAAAE